MPILMCCNCKSVGADGVCSEDNQKKTTARLHQWCRHHQLIVADNYENGVPVGEENSLSLIYIRMHAPKNMIDMGIVPDSVAKKYIPRFKIPPPEFYGEEEDQLKKLLRERAVKRSKKTLTPGGLKGKEKTLLSDSELKDLLFGKRY